MELLLNLAWVAVAAVLVCLWLRGDAWHNPDRRRQLIAIAVLIAILFPVISVSDDLLAVQNPAETDNYLRRDHLVPSHTPVLPLLAMIAPAIFAGLGFSFLRFVAPSLLPTLRPDRPELNGIDNRPPPVAA